MSLLSELLEEKLSQKSPTSQSAGPSKLRSLLDAKLTEKFVTPTPTVIKGDTAYPGYSQKELDLAKRAMGKGIIAEPVEQLETEEDAVKRIKRERMSDDERWLKDNYFPQEFLPLLTPVDRKKKYSLIDPASGPINLRPMTKRETFNENIKKLPKNDPLRQKAERIVQLQKKAIELYDKEQIAQGKKPEPHRYTGLWNEIKWLGDEALKASASMSGRAQAGLAGTLAEVSEGAVWDPETLRDYADKLYQQSQAKHLRQDEAGGISKVGQFVATSVAQAYPYMALSTAAYMVGGPAAAFGVGYSIEGEEAKRSIMDLGGSEEDGNLAKLIVGTLNGAIETLQVSNIIKFANEGKGSAKAILEAARKKAWADVKAMGKDLTYEALELSLREALEEALQEQTQITAELAVAPGSMTGKEIAARTGKSALGGAVVGPVLGGGGRLVNDLFGESKDKPFGPRLTPEEIEKAYKEAVESVVTKREMEQGRTARVQPQSQAWKGAQQAPPISEMTINTIPQLKELHGQLWAQLTEMQEAGATAEQQQELTDRINNIRHTINDMYNMPPGTYPFEPPAVTAHRIGLAEKEARARQRPVEGQTQETEADRTQKQEISQPAAKAPSEMMEAELYETFRNTSTKDPAWQELYDEIQKRKKVKTERGALRRIARNKEADYDSQKERQILGKERVGQEPGRAVQDEGGGRTEDQAGGVLQSEEGLEALGEKEYGDTYEGIAYRSEPEESYIKSNFGEKGRTLEDILNWEYYEMDHPFVYEEADEVLSDLNLNSSDIPANRLLWVADTEEFASGFGKKANKLDIPKGSVILSTDKEGGYLILLPEGYTGEMVESGKGSQVLPSDAIENLPAGWLEKNELPPQSAVPIEAAGAKQPAKKQGPPIVSKPVTEEKLALEDEEISALPTEQVQADPDRFQYKLDSTSEEGTSDRMRTVKRWNRKAAGIVLVWQDKNGQYFVVDGHHRLALAKRLGVETINSYVVRETDGVTAEEARVMGAMSNLVSQRGTAIDAAKLFKDSDISLETLEREGVDIDSVIIEQGLALKNLSDEVFRMVIDEKIPANLAAKIGQHIDDATKQKQVADMIAEGGVSTAREAELLTKTIDSAPVISKTEQTLFGADTTTKSLYVERAKVLAAVERILKTNKKVFGTLAKKSGIIEKAGNILDHTANLSLKEQAEEILYLLEKLVNAKGPVSEALNEATKEYAENPTNAKLTEVARSLLEKWQEELTIEQVGGIRKVSEKDSEKVGLFEAPAEKKPTSKKTRSQEKAEKRKKSTEEDPQDIFESDLREKSVATTPGGIVYSIISDKEKGEYSIERIIDGERTLIVGMRGEKFGSREHVISWARMDAKEKEFEKPEEPPPSEQPAKPKKPKPKPPAPTKRIVSDDAYEAAKKRLMDRNKLRSGIDPQGMSDLVIIGAYHFENGLRVFKQWSRKMVEDLGDWVKPHLEAAWPLIQSMMSDAKTPPVEKPAASGRLPFISDKPKIAKWQRDVVSKLAESDIKDLSDEELHRALDPTVLGERNFRLAKEMIDAGLTMDYVNEYKPEPDIVSDQLDKNNALIEEIVSIARKPVPDIREIFEYKGSNGKWYRVGGVPAGVELNMDEKRSIGFAFTDGTVTYGTMATSSRDQLIQSWDNREDANAEDLRTELKKKTFTQLQESAEFWRGEAAKKERLTGPKVKVPKSPDKVRTPKSAPKTELFTQKQDYTQILKSNDLTVEQKTSKKGTTYWAVTGKGTFQHKDLLTGLGAAKPIKIKGKWTRSFFDEADPTERIARAISGEEVEAAGTQGGTTQEPRTPQNSNEAVERKRKRAEEDARPDRSRISGDLHEFISDETISLIQRGADHNIPQNVLDDQNEDIALGIRSYEEGKGGFIVASDAGTGKTFVLGGLIRELRNRDEGRVIYVTMNQELIEQIKDDLKDYDIDHVRFYTYAGIRSENIDTTGAILIFDESQNIKNVTSQQGKAGKQMLKGAKFSVFASATPFENPVQAQYMDAARIFDRLGGWHEWAKMYGASVKVKKYYDYAAGKQVIEETLYWVGGRSVRKKLLDAQGWFRREGIWTQRNKTLPPGFVDSTFRKDNVDDEYLDLVNSLLIAYGAAEKAATENTDAAMVSMHASNTMKRVLEAGKVNMAIDRIKAFVAQGKQVVLFVETKAARHIGKFRKSGDAKGKLYSYPEMRDLYDEWKAIKDRLGWQEAGRAPFSSAIMLIAEAMYNEQINYVLPQVKELIVNALGKDNVAEYTGDVTSAEARKNLKRWKKNKVPILVATMAKGGTGLSLHDTTGNMPERVQVGLNLPWTATQVDQVAGRLARYGTAKKVLIEWLFADNVAFERTLSRKVGTRMGDMGALVRGVESGAGDNLQDFDFEDGFDATRQSSVSAEAVHEDPVDELYRRAEAMEKSRRKADDTTGDFFATPYPLAVLMGRIADVKPSDNVLEPSAGEGNLLRLLPGDPVKLTAVEQSPSRSDTMTKLKIAGYLNPRLEIVNQNFMEWTGEIYNVILMNPPFSQKKGEGWQDYNHVRRAYGMLSGNGRLVAIMSSGFEFRSDKASQEFRDWLERVGAIVVKLPEKVFKQSGTNVNTKMVIIDGDSEGGIDNLDLSDMESDTLRAFEDMIPKRGDSYGEDPQTDVRSHGGGFVGVPGKPKVKVSAIVNEDMSTGSRAADDFLARTKGFTSSGRPHILAQVVGHGKGIVRGFHYLEWLPKTPEFANIREHFRHTEEIARRAFDAATERMKWALKPLEGVKQELKARFHALELVLIGEDMMEDIDTGVDLPPGMNNDDVIALHHRGQQLKEKYPSVKKTYDRLRIVSQEIADMLIKEGMLDPARAKEFYFPHKVIKYLRAEDGFFGIPNKKPAEYKKGYQMQRKGGHDYSTDIMERLVEHWAEVQRDVAYRQFLEKVLKQEQENYFKQEYPDWEEFTTDEEGNKTRNLIPEGYKWVTVMPGRYYYSTYGISEDMARAIVEQNLNSIEEMFDQDVGNKVRKVLGMGKKRGYIVREPIARQIHDMPTMPISNNPAYLAVKGFNTFVKGQILFNPLYTVPFHVQNFIGDASKVFVALPSALQGRYLIDYWREIIAAHKGEKTKLFEAAQKYGVIGSGWVGVDIPELNKILPEIEKAEISGASKMVIRKAQKLWDIAKRVGAGREDWLRFALFDRLVDLQDQGKDISRYAIKDSQNIAAITDPLARAAKVARDLAGDYKAIGKTGRILSDLAIPFYRWMHLNLPWWPRMITEYAKKGQVGRLAYAISAAAIPYVAAMLWNYSDDDRRKFEQTLPPWKRWNFHINSLHGKKMYYVQLPLDDVLNFIGIPEDILDYQRYQRGMINGPELIKRLVINSTYEPGMSIVNSVGGLAAVVRDAIGWQTFPDWKDYRITDWKRKGLNISGDILGSPGQVGKQLYREGIRTDPDTGQIILGQKTRDTLNRAWMGIRPYSVDLDQTKSLLSKSIYKRTQYPKSKGHIKGRADKGKERLVDSLTIQLEGTNK